MRTETTHKDVATAPEDDKVGRKVEESLHQGSAKAGVDTALTTPGAEIVLKESSSHLKFTLQFQFRGKKHKSAIFVLSPETIV